MRKTLRKVYNMKAKKILVAAMGMFCAAQTAFAVPAYPGLIKFVQADGTEISIRLHGDEYGHYTTTEDGFPLVYNDATKNYEYATLENGKIVSCGIVASDVTSRNANTKKLLASINKEDIINNAVEMRKANIERLNGQLAQAKSKVLKSGKSPNRALINDFPHFGEQHSLVILLEFNNCSFSVVDDANKFYTDALNKEGFTYENGATGSARDYFIASSHGAFKPTFDVYGPVKIDYGVNDAGTGDQLTTVNTGTFLKAAIAQLDGKIDFKQYDHDGDGYVDNIYLYYAGFGAADSGKKNVIWPHSYNLEGWMTSYTTKDGVKIGQYTCSNEIDGQRPQYPCGIGTFVHEFGHCLGLADHYDVNNKVQSKAPGYWDTMATGSYTNNSNTPPLYSSYECYELGWIEPETLTNKTADVCTLPDLGSSNKAYRIAVPGNEDEYYMFENRQKTGWDTYLPGHGMLVWHIDYDKELWEANSVNTDGLHQHVDVVEANGEDSGGYSGLGGITFPGSSNVTTYDFKAWDKSSLIQLDKIKEENGTVSFIVKGSDSGITVPKAAISEVSYDSFKCSWDKVAGAEYYVVNVNKVGEGGNLTHVDGYTDLNVQENSLTVEGLDESSDYEISVASGCGSFNSDACSLRATTVVKPFDKYQVENVKADEITVNSFRATWDKVKDAQTYVVDLTKFDYNGEAKITAYDFKDKTDGMPEGWRSSSTNYSTTAGKYGTESPSLRFGLNRSYLIMKNGEANISDVEFWMAGSSITEGANVEVDRLDNDGNWAVVENIPLEETGKSYKVTVRPTSQVRLYFNRKGSSYAYIDDVSVSGNNPENVSVSAYTDKNVGADNAFVFDNLEQNTTYSLVVYGENNGVKTVASKAVMVLTKDETDGIKNVVTDDGHLKHVYDISGRQVSDNGTKTGIYIIKDHGKTSKVAR
mgnify:CR=1 FL=1